MKKILKRAAALLVVTTIMVQVFAVAGFPVATAAAAAATTDVLEDGAVLVTADTAVLDTNGYIQVTVSTENGGFLVATDEGDILNKDDNNKNLLYADEYYDTSFTSFRVYEADGSYNDYIFGREYGFLGLSSKMVSTTLNDATDTITSVWELNDLVFTQTLTLLNTENAAHGMVEISYQVQNNGTKDYTIEARVLLDTALGEQDYAYYELPSDEGSSANYKTVESEMLLDNTDDAVYDTVLFAYDDLTNPEIYAYTLNTNVGTETIVPTQVAFGHWNSLASTVFDFTPTEDLYFTNEYNIQYLTADSAYALYFEFGTVAAEGGSSTIATDYGIYSNYTNQYSDAVTVNFTKVAPMLELTEGVVEADGSITYSYVDGGEFEIGIQLQNITDNEISDITVEYSFQAGVYTSDGSSSYTDTIGRINAQGNADSTITLMATADNVATDYRTIYIKVYSDGTLIGEKETYVYCPGTGTDGIMVNSITQEIIYNQGSRSLFLSIAGVGGLKDTGAYSTVLTNQSTGQTVTVAPSGIMISSANNSMILELEETMDLGVWDITFDFNSDEIEDISSGNLTFMVSNDQSYMPASYGIITIERAATDGDDRYAYSIHVYEDQAEYDALNTDQNNLTLLEFKGIFQIEEGTQANPTKIVGVSDKLMDGTTQNTMVISNCLDIENGTLEIYDADGVIDVNIDAEVYTTGARTVVWDGVCALTSIEDGEAMELLQYDYMGNVVGDSVGQVENSVANTNAITLIWPSTAGVAQTVAGVLLEFRYAQFGLMTVESGSVTDESEKVRIIAFGAQLDPDLLVPASFVTNAMEQSSLEAEMENLTTNASNPYYTSDDLRNVQDKYAASQAAYETLANASLGLYVHDILFGGGFIGFNVSVDVGFPSLTDGIPGIEGTLDLKVINSEWGFGVNGVADLGVFEMEGKLVLQSYNSVPVLDTVYFYAGGFTPGVNVDGYGIFWIRGAGGGFSDLYATIFGTSVIPPLTLYVKGQFAIFSVLSATAEIGVSLQGVSGTLSDIGLSAGGVEINFIKMLTLEATWYPEMRLYGGMEISFFDVINGAGYIVLEENQDENEWFFEGYANANVSIPENTPIIGELSVGNIGVGLNTEKFWGAAEILYVNFGFSCEWADPELEFQIGKYDVTEPTYSLISYSTTEPDSGSMFMTLAVTNEPVQVMNVVETIDQYTHSLPILDDAENKDVFVTLSFNADSDAAAKEVASNMSVVDSDGNVKSLTWDMDLDSTAADDANAMLQSNGDGAYTILFTFTEAAQFGKTWLVTTTVNSTLEYYEIERLASLEGVTLNADNASATVNGDLDAMEKISIYAESNTDDSVYFLAEALAIDDGGLSGESKTIAFTIPQDLPTGGYTIVAVGTTMDKTSNPIVYAAEPFSYTNPCAPATPTISVVALGGDYTIDVTVAENDDADGYYVTVYELVDGAYVATDVAGLNYTKDSLTSNVLVVGGQYVSLTQDDDGNDVEQIYGLQAGRTYYVGVTAYKNVAADGYDDVTIEITSQEVRSSAVAMVAPLDTVVTLSLQGATNLTSAVMPTDGETTYSYPTSTSAGVTVVISATDALSSGQYKIDGGDLVAYDLSGSVSFTDLQSGMHTFYFQGENSKGDAVQETFVFNVDNVAPILLISTATQGFFNQEVGETFTTLNESNETETLALTTVGDTLTIKGESEENATLYISVEGVAQTPVVIGAGGTFEVDVALDTSLAYQFVQIWVEDLAGNVSKTVSMPFVNSKLSNDGASYAICLNGADVTATGIQESGVLSLAMVEGDNVITINYTSLAVANSVEWSVQIQEGTSSIVDNQLMYVDDTVGLVSVMVDTYVVSTALGQVVADEAAADAYSVELYWGAMEFTFTDETIGDWDASTHEYEVIEAAAWAATGNTVTVKNMSSKDIVASFAYASGSDFNTVEGLFDYTQVTVDGCQNLAVGEEAFVVSTLTLTGFLSDDTPESTTIGEVTVSIGVPSVDE